MVAFNRADKVEASFSFLIKLYFILYSGDSKKKTVKPTFQDFLKRKKTDQRFGTKDTQPKKRKTDEKITRKAKTAKVSIYIECFIGSFST